MATTTEILIPTSANVDCSSEITGLMDARTSYACTDSNLTVRLPIAVLHILALFTVFVIAGGLYFVFIRVCERRLASKLREPSTSKFLPVGRDVVSKRVQMQVFEGFASASMDFSPEEFIILRRRQQQRI
jgi:hypothetical protein